MVTTGNLIENTDAKDYFIGAVQTPAHNAIVYWDANRHTFNGVVAPTSEYYIDNPPTGASEAGLGADGTTVTATTVYNHLVAATYNITNIRQSAANFYVTVDNFSPDTPAENVYQGTVGPSITVRPIAFRQTVSNVGNAGVVAGTVAGASTYNDFCTNLYNAWAGLAGNRSDFNVVYCHTSCHTNCHTSRGRR